MDTRCFCEQQLTKPGKSFSFLNQCIFYWLWWHHLLICRILATKGDGGVRVDLTTWCTELVGGNVAQYGGLLTTRFFLWSRDCSVVFFSLSPSCARSGTHDWSSIDVRCHARVDRRGCNEAVPWENHQCRTIVLKRRMFGYEFEMYIIFSKFYTWLHYREKPDTKLLFFFWSLSLSLTHKRAINTNKNIPFLTVLTQIICR